MTKPPPTSRFYQVHVAAPHTEWARIWITDDGSISILSDYGNYGYWFGSPAREFRSFLVGCGDDYLINKFAAGKRVCDETETEKRIEAALREHFGGDGLTAELEIMRSVDFSNPVERMDWMHETQLDSEIIWHGDLFAECYPMQVTEFVRMLWPLFRAALQAELDRESALAAPGALAGALAHSGGS